MRSLVARRIHAKQEGNAHFLCLVQVTRIYIAVEETLLGFVLASKRVPRCKEEAVYINAQYVVLGPRLKVINLNIFPESSRNELKYSLKDSFYVPRDNAEV